MTNPNPHNGSVTVSEAQDQLLANDAVLIDVRTSMEYGCGHAAGAVNIPLNALASRAGEIPKDKTVLVICQSGHRSAMGVSELYSHGFEDVVNVAGGTSAWRQAALPVEPAKPDEGTCCPLVDMAMAFVRRLTGR